MHGTLNVRLSDNIEINLLFYGTVIFPIELNFRLYIVH